ncbi:hypothetical protein GCM10010201_00620 [Pilimelia columellifera subsp. columellifera]|uniref:Secreted protein n=1 Tax=Pilimelia columellifera subsp. columellifera TaxID=706583 RepID=A0ABN3MX00_9ACTN
MLAVSATALLTLGGCVDPASSSAEGLPQPTPSSTAANPEAVNQGSGPGDVAPHGAENNAWKRRHGISIDQQRRGDDVAALVRAALGRQRAAKKFDAATTDRTLRALKIADFELTVNPMSVPSYRTDVTPNPPLGAVFALQHERLCVDGDIRPERLLVQVEGAANEFGCIEPVSH